MNQRLVSIYDLTDEQWKKFKMYAIENNTAMSSLMRTFVLTTIGE